MHKEPQKDRYFLDPQVLADIQEGIAQYRAGEATKVGKAGFDRIL